VIQSPGLLAFQQALLKSERLPIRGVLGANGVGFLQRLIRVLIVGDPKNHFSWRQAVVEFSGDAKQQDDLTAVIIKRKQTTRPPSLSARRLRSSRRDSSGGNL